MTNKNMRMLVAIPLCVALIWVGSMISIPLVQVPITLQTLMVFVVGIYLGPIYGFVAVLLYLALGAVGVPVFAKFSSGLKVLTGPTGGFLWGFLLEVVIAGLITRVGKILPKTPYIFFALLLSFVAIFSVYLPGIPWFMHVLEKYNTLEKALPLVFYPFILGDVLKAVVGAVLCVLVYNRVKKAN